MRPREAPAYRRLRASLLISILLLAFALRCWKIGWDPIPGVDGPVYSIMADNLVEGRGFTTATQPPYNPTDFRTPLYPALLAVDYAILGHSPYPMMFLQALLDVITCGLVFRIAARFFGEGVGMPAAFLAATYLGSIVMSATLYTETLYFFLIVLSVFLLRDWPSTRSRNLLAAGFLLGLAMLTRPLTVLYPFVLGFILFWLARDRNKAVFQLFLLALAILAATGPWYLRNKLTLGRWELGDNILLYGMLLTSTEEQYAMPKDAQVLYAQGIEGTLSDEGRAEFLRDCIDGFKQRLGELGPLGYARVRAVQVSTMWLYPAVSFILHGENDMPWREALAAGDFLNLSLRALCLLYGGLIPAALFFIGLTRAWRTNPRTLLLLSFALYIFLPHLLIQADFRYVAPAFLLQTPIVALGLVALFQRAGFRWPVLGQAWLPPLAGR